MSAQPEPQQPGQRSRGRGGGHRDNCKGGGAQVCTREPWVQQGHTIHEVKQILAMTTPDTTQRAEPSEQSAKTYLTASQWGRVSEIKNKRHKHDGNGLRPMCM